MRAIFIHDHNFVYNSANGLYYDGSGGVFAANLWKRYLDVFEKLTVVGRLQSNSSNRLVVASAENVDFYLVKSLPRGINRYLGVASITSEINKVLETVDFAILRVPSTLGYIAQEICIDKGKPYVLEVVGCAWDAYWNYGSLAGKLLAPIEMFILKRSAARAKYCIYVTQSYLQRKYPTQGVSTGISNVKLDSLQSFQSAFSVYNEYMKLDTESEVFKIGLVGTFHVRYKGHVEAIKAMSYLVKHRELRKIKLLLVGTGDSSWITSEIEKYDMCANIEIIGALEAGAQGIFPFLDSLHLYIHPSKQEGLPRVVVEALSRGKLCLGSKVAGMPELLSEKYLHNAGDWKTLAHQIESVYKHKDEWAIAVRKNLKTAELYLESSLQVSRVNFLRDAIRASSKLGKTR